MFRRFAVALFSLVLLIPAATTYAQTYSGISVTCPNGRQITNGVEVVVNMRPGFTYTATALGVDGFDPVMAVMDRGTVRVCTDDSEDAAGYSANLPTTGQINTSARNAQLPFSHNYDGFEDISIIVGGFNGQGGEFLLILEGMSITANDGQGDPFVLRLTENMAFADRNSTVYMMTTNPQLDPLLNLVVDDEVVQSCDDAGNENLCDGPSSNLAGSYVSRTLGRETPSSNRNAMLELGTTNLTDLDYTEDWFFNFRMTSYQQSTLGEYIVAFHVAVAGDDAPAPESAPTTPASTNGGEKDSTAAIPGGGVDVVCPDGTQITNAVEFVVNMRPGFTYTATAVGVDGFDPIMGVGLTGGNVDFCEDDTSDASAYTANLPTTGPVSASAFNAQLPFSHSMDGFADISIYVGGYQGGTGEFVLILEGMAATGNDGTGDPFFMQLTPNIVNSGVNTAIYMIETQNALNPFFSWVSSDEEVFAVCDDSGTNTCDGDSFDLRGSSVSRTQGRQAEGTSESAMLLLPTSELTDLDFANSTFYLNFLMSRSDSGTGEYVVAFHTGIGANITDGGTK